jgi:hypothetical protein
VQQTEQAYSIISLGTREPLPKGPRNPTKLMAGGDGVTAIHAFTVASLHGAPRVVTIGDVIGLRLEPTAGNAILVMGITAGRKAACYMRLILQTRRKPMSKLETTDTHIKNGTKADHQLTKQELNKVSGGIINYKEFNGMPNILLNFWADKNDTGPWVPK